MGTTEEIKEWHFHTYWWARENHPTAAEAQRLHDVLLEEVKNDPSFVVVFNGVTDEIFSGLKGRPPPMNHRPVGPHPSGSFETWVPKESLPRALSWFTQNRGSLSVLIHPLTRYERQDHSTSAMWLGQPWPIDLQVLREDRGTAEVQYPELGLGYSSSSPSEETRFAQYTVVLAHCSYRNLNIAAHMMIRFVPHRWVVLLATIPRAEAKRKPTVTSMEEFWMFFAVVYGLVLLPVIGYFVYSLVRDPAAPEIVRLMWQWLKRKTFGFLSPTYRDPAVKHNHDVARSSDFQGSLRSLSRPRSAQPEAIIRKRQ